MADTTEVCLINVTDDDHSTGSSLRLSKLGVEVVRLFAAVEGRQGPTWGNSTPFSVPTTVVDVCVAVAVAAVVAAIVRHIRTAHPVSHLPSIPRASTLPLSVTQEQPEDEAEEEPFKRGEEEEEEEEEVVVVEAEAEAEAADAEKEEARLASPAPSEEQAGPRGEEPGEDEVQEEPLPAAPSQQKKEKREKKKTASSTVQAKKRRSPPSRNTRPKKLAPAKQQQQQQQEQQQEPSRGRPKNSGQRNISCWHPEQGAAPVRSRSAPAPCTLEEEMLPVFEQAEDETQVAACVPEETWCPPQPQCDHQPQGHPPTVIAGPNKYLEALKLQEEEEAAAWNYSRRAPPPTTIPSLSSSECCSNHSYAACSDPWHQDRLPSHSHPHPHPGCFPSVPYVNFDPADPTTPCVKLILGREPFEVEVFVSAADLRLSAAAESFLNCKGFITWCRDEIQSECNWGARCRYAHLTNAVTRRMLEEVLPPIPKPMCPQDKRCQLLNDPAHQDLYRHTCRIPDCPDAGEIWHAIPFYHPEPQPQQQSQHPYMVPPAMVSTLYGTVNDAPGHPYGQVPYY